MDTPVDPQVANAVLAELESRAAERQTVVELLAELNATETFGEQVGHIVPRLFTPPLVTGPPGPCYCGCALTDDTSYGFDVMRFAREVGRPLDPWQELAVIHIGELLPDGRPRFRVLVLIVARQNGKTELVAVLAAYWLFIEKQPMILGTSSNLEYAKEAWEKTVRMGMNNPYLRDMLPQTEAMGVRRTNGQVQVELAVPTRPGATYPHPRYRIAAANRRGGRSLTINRAIGDEFREQSSWDAWNAMVPATNAVIDAQIILPTNQGDDTAVVLDSVRESALSGIDERLGILEWSAPEGSLPNDLDGIAAANPNAGRRLSVPTLATWGEKVMEKGGVELADFQTEIMCMKVRKLNPAFNPVKWADCNEEGDLAGVRGRVAMVLDISIDQQHAAVVAAALVDHEERGENLVRIEGIEAWSGPNAVQKMVQELPGIVYLIKPKVVGWFPDGPAAAAAARLAERRPGKRTPRWPPRGVELVPITKDVCAVCMEFVNEVDSGMVLHSDDPLINDHVLGAEKLWLGDKWRYARRDVGHVNAAYAAAGAAHLARTLPAPRPAAGAA
jgi:hypothetical protein